MRKYMLWLGILLCFGGLWAQKEIGGAFSYPTLSVRNAALGRNGTAVFLEGENVFVNPAFLSYLNDRQLGACYAQLYEFDDVQLFSGYFAQSTREHVSAAVSLSNLKISGLMRTETEEWDPYSEIKAGYHYAQRMGVLSVALSGYYLGVKSDLRDYQQHRGNADGLSIDVSSVAELATWKERPLFWGMHVQNVYSFLKWRSERKEKLPIQWQTGISHQWRQYLWALSVSGDEAAYLRAGGLGASGSFFENILTLRAGGQYDLEEKEPIWGMGVGISYQTINFDYAYEMNSNDLGNTHRFSIKTAF